jgi:hypothetical protein
MICLVALSMVCLSQSSIAYRCKEQLQSSNVPRSCAFPIVIVMKVAVRRIQERREPRKPNANPEQASKSMPSIPKIQLSFALTFWAKPNPRAL